MGTVRDDMTLALRLAEQADALTLDRFGAMDLHVDTKPDLTPVTDADRSVESALRDTLATERPDDSVLGEEFGGTTVFTGRQWVIDPIDGTKNFVRGVPIWATLIALMQRWRAGCRRGKRAGAAATLVGRRGRRGVCRGLGGIAQTPCRCHRWPRSGRRACHFPACRAGPSSACGTGSSTSPTPFGGYAATATSCPTAWWPREPSTSPQNPRYRCGTSPRSTSWCARPAGPSPASTGPPGPHGGNAVATNGRLHDAVLTSLHRA